MKRYPRLVACPFTGVLKKVHSLEQEQAFKKNSLYMLVVIMTLFVGVGICFLAM